MVQHNIKILPKNTESLPEYRAIRLLAALKPYTIEICNGLVIAWSFENIQLPPAGDADASNSGFISFRILVKRPALAGAVVKNNAQITFDTSGPAATNTVVTEIR